MQKWYSKLLASMETGIVLRAVAIVFIVATHIDFFSWEGTAHVLMALAGYNFARFQLTGSRRERLRRQLRAVARIVVPSIAVIGLAFVVTDDYRWHNVFLLNSLVGPPGWTDLSRFWFVEVLVHILLGLAILLVIPGVDRALRRWPWGFPLVLAGIDLLQRFDVIELPYPGQGPVLWLFAFGWAAAVSRRWWQRAAMTALALLTIPGSFPDEYRSATILVGFLILLWIPTLPVPRGLHRITALLASSSLYIYVTHWLVYPYFDEFSKAWLWRHPWRQEWRTGPWQPARWATPNGGFGVTIPAADVPNCRTAGALLLADAPSLPEAERKLTRSIILDWCARRLFRDRPTIASEAAGVQHADVVRHPNDAQANHPSENSQ